MGNALVVLAIVTQTGMINQDLKFNSLEQCEAARANIQNLESFCFVPGQVDMDQAFAQFDSILEKLQESMRRAKERQNNNI